MCPKRAHAIYANRYSQYFLTNKIYLIMRKLNFLVTVVCVFILGSCSKNDDTLKNYHLITVDQAIEIAKENRNTSIIDEKKLSQRGDDFILLNTFTLDDENNIPSLYIINYKIGGNEFFNIISADSRLDNVLAYGERTIQQSDIVEGLSVWINEQIRLIQEIRNRNLTKYEVLTDIIQARVLPKDKTNCCEECPNYPDCLIFPWLGCGEPDINCEYDPCEGISIYISVGPLMTSRWGQGCDYNADCPIRGCNQLPCGSTRALTGCVATAMSQIIRHHAFPAGYDYNNMLNDYTALRADGNPANDPTPAQVEAVARLMRDAGNEVDMVYGCNISTAFTCDEVPGAMTGFFNYTTTNNCQNYSTASFNIIRNDIDHNRPLLFRGNGHAWVCDGYRVIKYCAEVELPSGGQGIIVYAPRYYLYMNWGRNGFGNGFFDYSAANGGFESQEQFINNINP